MPMIDASAYRPVRGYPQATWVVMRHWQAATPPELNSGLAKVDPTLVQLNHGRWVAMCPDCNSAQYASQTDPRMLCVECGNVKLKGKWRPLAWPSNRAAIETAVQGRPPINQNWLPGEKVGDLTRITREMGF